MLLLIQPVSRFTARTNGTKKKHGAPARRTWRKLHLAVDENHRLLTCELTTPEVNDPTAVPGLLVQIDTPFDTFVTNGVYDREPTVQRYKRIFDKPMKARALPQQKIKTWMSASALNRIANLGMLMFIKI